MNFLDEIIDLIDAGIREDSSNIITAGGIIKEGFDEAIDKDKNIVQEAHNWICEYQKKLISETGVQNIKIKYTNIAGYFIEVSKTQASKMPEYFIQKQALVQVNRYTTQDLRDFEKKIFIADSDLCAKEYKAFLDIRNIILGHFSNIYTLSRKTAFIDYLVNGAYISVKRGYKEASIKAKFETKIWGGKHPVISLQEKDFISNDMLLDSKDFIHIITGPNMGGKSTYLRQNALLILIAHMGYDIPCFQAEISLTDKIFSRVGAGDNIYLGQSTFMVEMQEVAFILRNSTKKSFIIIDEIGRGTSTYDGMSLASAVLRYNQSKIGAKTLFATHYHEIIDHANSLKGVSNYSVAVGENNENIVFLRKIIPGGMKKSYGIEVAKLAGIPEDVLASAREIMLDFKREKEGTQLSLELSPKVSRGSHEKQEVYKGEIYTTIAGIDIDNISPMQALQTIVELQEQIKKSK